MIKLLWSIIFLFILCSCVGTENIKENHHRVVKNSPKEIVKKVDIVEEIDKKEVAKLKLKSFIEEEKNKIIILENRLDEFTKKENDITFKIKKILNKNNFLNLKGLINSYNNLIQGEFEKSVAFQKRKAKLKDKLNLEKLYASNYEPEYFIYNTDLEILQLKIGRLHSSYGNYVYKVTNDNYRVKLRDKKDHSSYVGSNAFGASVKVNNTYVYTDILLITDPDIINNLNNTWFYTKMSVNKAKKVFKKLKHKVIYKIKDRNELIEETYGHSATFTSPNSSYYQKNLLKVEVVGFAIYQNKSIIKTISQYEKAIISLKEAIIYRQERLKKIISHKAIPNQSTNSKEICLQDGQVWRQNAFSSEWECSIY